MDESQVRALFAEQSRTEPPPSQVSIGLARSEGCRRLRRRRAGIAGAPVLAVAAIVAVFLAASPAAPARPGASSSPAASNLPPAPQRFNPLLPYAAFGWLPPGLALVSGSSGTTEMNLFARPFTLTVHSANRPCILQGRQLNCVDAGQGTIPLASSAPAVHGQPAFWTKDHARLVFRYASGGWAVLSLGKNRGPQERRDAVHIADQVRFGAAARSQLSFPAQISPAPDRWRIDSASFLPYGGKLWASKFFIAPGHGVPLYFSIYPTTARSTCRLKKGLRSAPELIDGHQVTISRQLAIPGNQRLQILCAADADGLSVFIAENGGHFAMGVATLFAHHLRLLGPQPANWTTRLLG
jgi:hypothetical protein